MKISMHCGQGSETGDAADTCLTAAESSDATRNTGTSSSSVAEPEKPSIIPRSESYRRIIEAEDENAGFINRFESNVKLVNIEQASRSKTVKMYERISNEAISNINASVLQIRLL